MLGAPLEIWEGQELPLPPTEAWVGRWHGPRTPRGDRGGGWADGILELMGLHLTIPPDALLGEKNNPIGQVPIILRKSIPNCRSGSMWGDKVPDWAPHDLAHPLLTTDQQGEGSQRVGLSKPRSLIYNEGKSPGDASLARDQRRVT